MLAIAANALYISLLRRGTTRQLASAIVTCVVSALLLLPAILWYHWRFENVQGALSSAEIQVALVYVMLWGWVVPLSITSSFCLFTFPRTSTNSTYIPSQRRSTLTNAKTALQPPRRQPGVVPSYVFPDDSPWGWLEHRGGRFQGQRLELKRAIVTIGRGEDNDIWLDDEMASRYHAELAWDQGQVYITDCDSLNGVLLNGRRIRRSALIASQELLEIGSHRFIFIQADSKDSSLELSDPLAHHTWRSSLEPLTVNSRAYNDAWPPTRPLVDNGIHNPTTPPIASLSAADVAMTPSWQETAEIEQVSSPPQALGPGAMSICDGELAGKMFLLDRPFIIVGRGSECDVVIDDASISRIHVQFSRQTDGSYVQDLVSRNGTKVNDEPLTKPHLLMQGDVVCIGNIRLEYIEVTTASTIPLSFIITPHPFTRSMSGPVPLRLPSKPKL